MPNLLFACLAAISLLTVQLAATELKPWHGRIYDLDVRGNCLLQQFQKVDTECGAVKRPEFDSFYHLSALIVAAESMTAEMEISVLETRHQSFGLDAARLTGRYFLLNDVVGDPVSATAGLTVSQIFKAAKHSIATFDHGGIACEAHFAVGKELSCEQFWTSRAWGVLAVGVADVGSPWLRANVAWERNWWERHHVEVFADSVWGLGNDNLKFCRDFRGYGSINYQAVDIGLRYGLRLDNDTLLSLGYAYRAYGRNCPRDVNLLLLKVCYPLGL